MSSILKALEKVEQAQNAKRGGPSGLVKSRQRRPVWVLPVGIIGGAVVASVITFAVMGGFGKAREAVKPTAASTRPLTTEMVNTPEVKPEQRGNSVAAPKAEAVAVPVPARAAKAASAQPSVPHKPAVAAKKGAVPAVGVPASMKAVANKAARPVKAAKKAAVVPLDPARNAHAVAAVHPAAAPALQPAAVQPAAVSQPAKQEAAATPVQAPAKSRPEIRVNGIAWQNNSESSQAIINGRMVSQGVTVDGFKVERIFEDKVRLSGKNGTIDVPLGGGE